MPPVVNRLRRQIVATLDHAGMFAQDVALGRHPPPVGIDPQADGSVREGCEGTMAPVGPRKPVARNTIAIALEADQTPSRRCRHRLPGNGSARHACSAR